MNGNADDVDPDSIERHMRELSGFAQELPAAFDAPTLDARFRIESELGRGGQAVVYRAFDLQDQRVGALKVLNTIVGHSGDLFERFRR